MPLSMSILSLLVAKWIRLMRQAHAVVPRALADDLLITSFDSSEGLALGDHLDEHTAAVAATL
eukprot:10739235-Alexandrium_andersonii.AAC.1